MSPLRDVSERLKMTYRLGKDILRAYDIVRDGIKLPHLDVDRRCFGIPYNNILVKFIDWKAYFEANNLRN